MGFAELNSLETQLNTLESNLKSYKNQLVKLKKRKGVVEDIVGNMQTVCNSKSSDINVYINSIVNSFDSAIKGE